MRAAQVDQLDAVLEHAQETVGAIELSRVVAADVAGLAQRVDGRGGGAHAQGLIDPAVHELQQLDGELDVPQAAGAELELAREFLAAGCWP